MHTYDGIADEKQTGKRLTKEDGEIHDAATGDNDNGDDETSDDGDDDDDVDDDNNCMYDA